MKRSVRDLIGYPVEAQDGKVGKVRDVLFGDRHWRVRFLDVDSRRGLHAYLRHRYEAGFGEGNPTRFLIERDVLGEPTLGIDRRTIGLRLKRSEVEERPSLTETQPVEEKYESEFRRFFRRTLAEETGFSGTYGSAGYLPTLAAYDHSDEDLHEHLRRMDAIAGEHMHSAKAVLGYRVRSAEETLGSVADLIVSVETWTIDALVLTTHRGFPSRKYLLPMESVIRFDWARSGVEVSEGSEMLCDELRYWAYDPVNRDEKGNDYDYYGRPCLKAMMTELY